MIYPYARSESDKMVMRDEQVNTTKTFERRWHGFFLSFRGDFDKHR